ncbi:MAG: isocitrate/isopropylmalate dehydrogenase family protein [Bacteroidota bacterium]|nr:isocitrate/isopropylmalate dehydrogenase family protein [Bacteroidota bacterium]MDE2956374.1 isocitrate/isopropylmalate dehydrogenase family protein [Bacteroidota bacterium]
MSRYTVTLLPGDGIGPEVTDAVCTVLRAAEVPIEWERFDSVGHAGMEAHGTPLPEAVLESIRRNRVALKGPVTTPLVEGFRSVNVSLRQKLDLYANVRPCRNLPGVETRFEEVDLVIFRENTEGLYSGIETYDERLQIADSIARITRRGSQRILRFAFEWARANGRQRMTAVHKANVVKISTGLFLQEAIAMAPEYPEIEFDHRIVDNMAMQLVMRPEEFDCVVTTNLFGDILSDLCAGLVGGLGLVPGANIGDDAAVFEAVHGSAPDIAGHKKANPTALIRTAILMLRHLGESAAAGAVESALLQLYREGRWLTRDVGGSCSTGEFALRLAERVQNVSHAIDRTGS